MGDRLRGKVAIVTGAGSGIGRATALRFAAEGAKLVVNDLDADAAGRVAKEIEAAGGIATAFPADVADSRQVEALVREAIARFGGLDVLVNNAGVLYQGVLGMVEMPKVRDMFEVNVRKTFTLSVYG